MKISSKPTNPVPLVTQGDLSLYFVGCGSAFARTLYQNNLLITKGNHHLLIDCGTRCSQALHEATNFRVNVIVCGPALACQTLSTVDDNYYYLGKLAQHTWS